jgi:deoxyribose-phosphate aldolase
MISTARSALASRILPLIDLTNLSDDCDAKQIDALVAAASLPEGHVAALCVWPRFVRAAADGVAGTDIAVATVVNFPGGDESLTSVLTIVEQALGDGAGEIDLVLPYRDFLAGDEAGCREMIAGVRSVMPDQAHLKVILESGALADGSVIARASLLALECGANFLKTSTGKFPTGATLTAAETMLSVLRDVEKPGGFKASGGISSLENAAEYLACADAIMGPDWVCPDNFRFGASSLLADVRAGLAGV